jgi:hypothetical protein
MKIRFKFFDFHKGNAELTATPLEGPFFNGEKQGKE